MPESNTLPKPLEKSPNEGLKSLKSEDLTPPSHEEKVEIVNPDDDNDSIKPVPLTKQVIEVVATRKGFYGQQRIVAGQTFKIAKEEDLGEWMTCTNPEMEKKRKKFFKDKKARK